jgi:ribosomal protein L37AE/L43A
MGIANRVCEECSFKMPAFTPRMRAEDGRLLCPGCHPDGKGAPGLPQGLNGRNATRKTADSVRAQGACPECGGDLLVFEGSDTDDWQCTSCELRGIVDRDGNMRWGPYNEINGGVEASRKTAKKCVHVYCSNEAEEGKALCSEHSKVEENERAWSTGSKTASDRTESFGPAPTDGQRDTCARCGDEIEGTDGMWVHVFSWQRQCSDGDPDVATPEDETGYKWGDPDPTTASRRKVAHDSGDGATIYHCPFCGGGNVIARSDKSTECGYCQTAFTVQVQPIHSNMPQTDPTTGEAIVDPNMPGAPGVPGEVPGEQKSQDGVFEPPDATAPAFIPPTQAPAQPGQPVAASRFYVTAKGVAISEEAYLRHLAIQHADDKAAVIEQVRLSRT